ncbi:RNA-binding protein, partial [Neoconidiobolus thromboides FSU 785]
RSYASKSIYVGNLPWSTTKPELTELFSSHSEVYGVSIPIDGLGRSKGFAFVEVNEDGAVEAINALNNTDFKGRTIRISEA